MPTLRIILPRRTSPTPAILEAARAVWKARVMRCERISVERDGGVKRVEFPLTLVENFIATYSLKPHIGELFDVRLGNQETHAPLWRGTSWSDCHEDGADRSSAADQTRAPHAPEGGCAPQSRGARRAESGIEGDANGTR
jgi:hypothetical protein